MQYIFHILKYIIIYFVIDLRKFTEIYSYIQKKLNAEKKKKRLI